MREELNLRGDLRPPCVYALILYQWSSVTVSIEETLLQHFLKDFYLSSLLWWYWIKSRTKKIKTKLSSFLLIEPKPHISSYFSKIVQLTACNSIYKHFSNLICSYLVNILAQAREIIKKIQHNNISYTLSYILIKTFLLFSQEKAVLIFQQTATPKKFLIFSEKKVVLIFQETETLKKRSLYFRKMNFLIFQET